MKKDEETLLIVGVMFGAFWLWQQIQTAQSQLATLSNSTQPIGTLANTLNGYVPVVANAINTWASSSN